MEIQIGKYSIPDGCTAFIGKGQIVVRPKLRRRLLDGCSRCGACRFYDDMRCLIRPKDVINGRTTYHSASKQDRACDLFQKRGGQNEK